MTDPRPERSKPRIITSPANPLLKIFRHALADGVTREGWLAVEGPHALEEALAAGANATVQSVLASESAGQQFHVLLNRLPREAEVVLVDDQLFARVASTQSPQGIAALVELARGDLDAVIRRHDTLLVVACGLQDPGNLGTIMRSAVALGATGLLCLKETVSPFNPKAARASAGAIFHLPIIIGLDATDLFPRLRSAHVRTIGAERESPHALHQTDLQGPLAFLIGKEATGLSQDILNRADMLLSIPIRPGMDSVNAATAAGIFLYEAARQRGFKIMCG